MKNFNKHIYNLCHNYQYKLHALTRAYSLSYNYNLTPPISQVLISQYLIFCSRRHQGFVNRLEGVRQLNIKRGQKLDFQLSHRQPPSHEIYHDRKRLDIEYFIYRKSILLKTFDYYTKNIHQLLILEMLIH